MKTQPAQPSTTQSRRTPLGHPLPSEEKPGRNLKRERLAESSAGNLSEATKPDPQALQHRLPLESREEEPSLTKVGTQKARRSPAAAPEAEVVCPPQESLQLPQFPLTHSPGSTPLSQPDPEPSQAIVLTNPPALTRQKPPVEVLQQQIQSGRQHLEAKVAYINQLAEDLESALFDLKAISTQVNQDRRALQDLHGAYTKSGLQPTCQYAKAAIPRIKRNQNGSFRLLMRRIDLLKPEREAVSTAQFLRNWASKRQAHPAPAIAPASTATLPAPAASPLDQTRALLVKSRPKKPWRWLKTWLKLPQDRSAFITDASLWIVGSAALRIGLQWLLVTYPALWAPIILLLVTPAMVVAYQVTFMAQSGLILGYRLLLILVGLLLGGRL